MARILFVSPMSTQGGPVYILLKFVEHVSQQHGVAVLASGSGELFDILEQMGIPGYRTGPHSLRRWGIPWLGRLVRNEEFDLVYGCGYRSGVRNALIAAKLIGKPFIWHINEQVKVGKRRKWRTAFFLRYADEIIGDSHACIEAIKHYVPNRNVHLVYNGIEPDEYQLDVAEARQHVRSTLGVPSENLVIVNAGIVCGRKGQAYGLETAMGVLRAYSEVTFAFLGALDVEPEYALPLKERVERLGVADRIQFLGFRTDFARFLVGSDVFFHTAARDPFPVAVLGAMAARLPVVAFGVDGLKEQVVDGETGYLVPFGDVNGMVKALKKCLASPSLRKCLGEKGWQRALALFTAEEMGRRVSAIINRVLERNA